MRYPIWSVELNMKLGKEKTKFSAKVNLGDDVRTVLTNMRDVRENTISEINDAYEAILVSAAKDMAARKQKKIKK
jgi:hypothetical protein